MGCTISVETSEFKRNTANTNSNRAGGGVFCSSHDNITIKESKFDRNTAISRGNYSGGGVLYSYRSNITTTASKFNDNTANGISIRVSKFDGSTALSKGHHSGGGVLHSRKCIITVETSEFNDNIAFSRGVKSGGGVMYSKECTITIETSYFDSNMATTLNTETKNNGGGVLGIINSVIVIKASIFNSNGVVGIGGVIYSWDSNVTIVVSLFYNNIATNDGGVLLCHNSSITIEGSSSNNTERTVEHTINGSTRLVNNRATLGDGVLYLSYSELKVKNSGSLILSSNVGSLIAVLSNITFIGCVEFYRNNHPRTTQLNINTSILQGSAIILYQSVGYFNGNCTVHHHIHAENGGGLMSEASQIYVNGDLTIANNKATRNGGGVYLLNSELTCHQKSTFLLSNNHAGHKGGGIHAIGSSIKAISRYSKSENIKSYIGAKLNFTKNVAEMGGGLSLEANAKLNIMKYDQMDVHGGNTTVFTANSAHSYGGAVYVDDDTNSGTCTSYSKMECFFQVLHASVHLDPYLEQSMHFSQNHAKISGSTLYGGLLDRCTVSQFAEIYVKYGRSYFDGVDYFLQVSIPIYKTFEGKELYINTNISISSGPVKVCLCNEIEHNCSYQLPAPVEVKKGEAFNVSLIAVDQVEQPIDATIHASLKFPESGLSEGQLTTEIDGECTNLTFNVVSPHKYENLTLYAIDGPCKDADLSRRIVQIHFLPCSCPIGLQISGKVEINCTCDCHSNISQYVEQCDGHTGTLIKNPNQEPGFPTSLVIMM